MTEQMLALIGSMCESLDRIAESLESTRATLEKIANPVYECVLVRETDDDGPSLADGSPIKTELQPNGGYYDGWDGE